MFGASEVGSVIKLQPGDRGDEVGSFIYCGSSILVAFEEGRVEWDEDSMREASLPGLMLDARVEVLCAMTDWAS